MEVVESKVNLSELADAAGSEASSPTTAPPPSPPRSVGSASVIPERLRLKNMARARKTLQNYVNHCTHRSPQFGATAPLPHPLHTPNTPIVFIVYQIGTDCPCLMVLLVLETTSVLHDLDTVF